MAQDLGHGVRLHCGDCLLELDKLKRNSIDACITDPPYHLTSIVKRFSNAKPANEHFANNNPSIQFGRLSRGFMGKQWDGGDIAFNAATWRRIYRVLKPGAHLLAFGGSRTFHRMAVAIEDAGFEIRDTVMWVYGEGFPKSRDISKSIDKLKGAQRDYVPVTGALHHGRSNIEYGHTIEGQQLSHIPITPEAERWNGWGTALKPSLEPLILARKPVSEKNVTLNVLKWGTGALNVEASRIGATGGMGRVIQQHDELRSEAGWGYRKAEIDDTVRGRWPSNLLHDGSEEVELCFPHSQSQRSVLTSTPGNIYGGGAGLPSHTAEYGYDEQAGSNARFYAAFPYQDGERERNQRLFYAPKADHDDRRGSKHPTIKPVALLKYLIKLVTPPNGVVLDPFAGTGTLGEAAALTGFRAVLMEREREYQQDIRRRMATMRGHDRALARDQAKHRDAFEFGGIWS